MQELHKCEQLLGTYGSPHFAMEQPVPDESKIAPQSPQLAEDFAEILLRRGAPERQIQQELQPMQLLLPGPNGSVDESFNKSDT